MRVLWATALVLLVDQVTKVLVKLTMYSGESIPVVGRLFRITFTENPGMAFGLTLGSKAFLSLFSVVATVAILLYLRHLREAPFGYRLALALVLGGALGNVIDRVFYGLFWGYGPLLYGNVVDFIHLDVWRGTVSESVPLLGGRFFALFPIGNVADLAIIAGVVLILMTQGALQAYMEDRQRAEREALAPAEAPSVAVGPVPAQPTSTGGPPSV